jgi:hypothetical protein
MQNGQSQQPHPKHSHDLATLRIRMQDACYTAKSGSQGSSRG